MSALRDSVVTFLRDLGELAFVIVVVEPLRRRYEPLLVPGAVITPVQVHDRESWIGDFPYRRYCVGDALRLVDDDVHEPVVALEGERAPRACRRRTSSYCETRSLAGIRRALHCSARCSRSSSDERRP